MDAATLVERIEYIVRDRTLPFDEAIARIREIVGTESKAPKIIQIDAVYDYGENGRYQPHVRVFALYDDGTVKQSSPAFVEEGWTPYAATVALDVLEPDPIAELEELDPRVLVISTGERHYATLSAAVEGSSDPRTYEAEEMGSSFTIADLRAAAARLLARVRGAK